MSNMETAYKIAALAVRQRFTEQHSEDLKVLESIVRGDIAVFEDEFADSSPDEYRELPERIAFQRADRQSPCRPKYQPIPVVHPDTVH